MVGLIPNILVKLIEETAGPEAVAEVKHRAKVPSERTYGLNTVCSDDEWQRLLVAARDVLSLSVEEAEEAYAEFFYRDAVKSWPTWFEMSANSREFLERQPVIHNTMATGLQDAAARKAVTDKFHIVSSNEELVVHYKSPNQLCGLYKAMARSIIKHYGDCASIEEPRCVKRGDQECEIHVCWESNGAKS